MTDFSNNDASTGGLPVLTPDPAEILRIQGSISVTEREEISMFGEGAHRNVTKFVDKILMSVRNQDLGSSGDLLKDIILKSKKLDPSSIQKSGLLSGLFKSAQARVTRFKANFDDVAGQIDRIDIELDRNRDKLRRDVAVLGELHEQTIKSIIHLDAYIEAGKAFAAKFRQVDLPGLASIMERAKGTAGSGVLEAQHYQDSVQAIDRFEKRVYTLQQARMIGLQQLGQIRIIQAGNMSLIESLQATSSETIPLWKQRFVIALSLHNQQSALDLQNLVTNANNDLLRETSAMMGQGAVGIEKASQRGIVDIETLEKANQDLIDTVRTVLLMQDEGREARAVAEKKMQEMAADLKSALGAVIAS